MFEPAPSTVTMSDAVVDFEDSGDELELEEREPEHDDRTTQNYDSNDAGSSGGAGKSKKKGRGFKTSTGDQDRYSGRAGKFESVTAAGKGSGPAKSVEGWIVFITGIHEEAQEEDVLDEFREFGEVLSIDVNIDRRTGFLKGYGMVEFSTFAEAEKALSATVKVMGKPVSCSWCFSKGPCRKVQMPKA